MGRFSSTVVDHFTNPRNSGEIADASVRAFVGNPVCGDQILLTAVVRDGVVDEVLFRAHGCAASLATASLLTEQAKGQTLETIFAWDESDLEAMLGGLSPDHRHVAVLGSQVAHRLVENYRQGTNDDDPITCGA